MAGVERTQGFLLEGPNGLEAWALYGGGSGMAEGQSRGPGGNVGEPWSHCEPSYKSGFSPMGSRKPPQKA